MEDYLEIFRLNVKYYREQKGFSQRDLAIQADCTDGSIGMLESGKSKPSFDMILKLSRALCVHPADLFLRDASKSKADVKKILDELLDKDFKNLVSQKFSL